MKNIFFVFVRLLIVINKDQSRTYFSNLERIFQEMLFHQITERALLQTIFLTENESIIFETAKFVSISFAAREQLLPQPSLAKCKV